MTAFPPNINKLSAFRHRNTIKYLQSIYRATPSLNLYAYSSEHINEFITIINGLLNDSSSFKDKIWRAYECLFREIAMCDNYVKLSLEQYQNSIGATNFEIINYIENSLSGSYQGFLNYREALWDQATLLIEHANSNIVDETLQNVLFQINSKVYEITNTLHPGYYVSEYMQPHVVETYTPYNVNIDDVSTIWFDNYHDYKYILERCENSNACSKLVRSDIKRVKDLYYTFYSLGIRLIYDVVIKGVASDTGDINILTRKMSSLLLLDIKLRDCQTKHSQIQNDISDSSQGHLQWRQNIWNDAVTLYDMSSVDDETRVPYLSKIFDAIISNTNNLHRDQQLYNSLSVMSPKVFISTLTRFIPE